MQSNFADSSNARRLKTMAVMMLVFVMIVCAVVLNVGVMKFGNEKKVFAKDGFIDLTEYDMKYEKPFSLRGEWLVYDRALTPDNLDAYSPWLETLPRTNIDDTNEQESYLIRFKTNSSRLAFYFEYATYNTKIYIDDILLNNEDMADQGHSSMTGKYFFSVNLSPKDEHSILITTTQNSIDLPMFKHAPVISGASVMGNHTVWMWGINFFLMGMVVVVLLNGFIFMFIRPEHTLITSQTVFESFLGWRILFGASTTYMLLYSLLDINVGYSAGIKLEVITLLLSGYGGNKLVAHLFRKGECTPITKYICFVFIIEAVMTALLPLRMMNTLRYVYAATYLVNYAVLAPKVLSVPLRNKGFYNIIQSFKTVFICVVIILDMLDITGLLVTMHGYFVYYCTFFMMHIIIKLVDNNASYRVSEELTNNLEQQVAERTSQLLRANRKLERLSTEDALTGAFNRLYFERYTEAAMDEYLHRPYEFTMSVVDLDYFKKVNDKYGHDIGDEVLKETVIVIRENLPPGMELFRIGGEEFVVTSKHIPYKEIKTRMDHIRTAIMNNKYVNGIHVTASIGMAKLGNSMDMKDLFRLTDQCLYAAKKSGRNQLKTPDLMGYHNNRSLPY